MIEDFRKLKSGDLLQVHDGLYFKTQGREKFLESSRTEEDEVILFLKLLKRENEVLVGFSHALGAEMSRKSDHYYILALRKDQLVEIFFHTITPTNAPLPRDLANTRYATYSFSVVSK